MNFNCMDNIVKEEIVLCNERMIWESEENIIHIGYGIDDKFVMPMGVAIVSILEHNQQEQIVFHILAESLTDESVATLRSLVHQYRTKIVVHYIDGKVFKDLPITGHFTKAMYNRFFLTKVLKNIAKRVLYIDADILCYGSLGNLKKLDFKDNVAAVVKDIDAVAERQILKLQLKNPQYFNSGFLYIDIAVWEKQCISEKALAFSFSHREKLKWPDQDALNFVLNDKVLFIQNRYDYIFDFSTKGNSHITALPEDVIFVHYAGRHKPWQAWCMHPLQKDFIKYQQLSPWKDNPLFQPQNYKDMKKMARSYLFYGNMGQSIVWYIKYAYHKMKNRGK